MSSEGAVKNLSQLAQLLVVKDVEDRLLYFIN